ncbi:MAG TPA: adenylate/guanylate cyclase domain-containing protein, partial [Stellaceae bacterium]|nr:adenylate/guanylate cyclase domain-containing protein [Stellaceae bacterium]
MREPPGEIDFDSALGRQVVELHVWAVSEGLRGVAADALFDGFCQRLVIAGIPLWRGYVAMNTLHPQWGGYSYTWRRDLNAIEPEQFERAVYHGRSWFDSPFAYLLSELNAFSEEADPWRHLRRRLAGPEAKLDFPILEEFVAAGATDYFAEIVRFGADGDPSRGIGVGYSFTSDRPQGFREDDLQLLKAVLPALSLALMTHAGHTIASGLLAAYLGGDAGRRVHSGAVDRGSVESIRAVLWYADIRSFTAIADTTPGQQVIELLNEVFETITGPLRRGGGQVLKFMGDGLLAIFPFDEATKQTTCLQALDAAAEAMQELDRLNAVRAEAGRPVAAVDVALHLGEVLYGNIGAVDRLDFTVIGPAVNEASRIETLCEPLGRKVLVSAEFAAAAGSYNGLHP